MTHIKSKLAVAVIMSMLFASGPLLPLRAEITFDGTLGSTGTISGDMLILDMMGMVAGRNLFHSFSIFNVDPGESATFSAPNFSVDNVIGRPDCGRRPAAVQRTTSSQ